MLNNYQLMALLEATKDKETGMEDPFADDAATDVTEPEAGDTDTPEDNNDEAPKDDDQNTDDSNKDDKNKQEEKKDDSEQNKDDTNDSGDDDFNMDPDGGSEDSGDNPDGLPDPDDDGMDDTDGVEQNIHLNILELSKLDRLMAKRKIYNDYKDLRASITSAKNLIDQNEAVIDADVRDYVVNKLDYLLSVVTDHLTYKFSFTNYEENLQAYLIFTKQLNDLLNFTRDNKDGFKESPTKSASSKKSSKKPKEEDDDKIDVDKSIEEQEDESEDTEDELSDEDLEPDFS